MATQTTKSKKAPDLRQLFNDGASEAAAKIKSGQRGPFTFQGPAGHTSGLAQQSVFLLTRRYLEQNHQVIEAIVVSKSPNGDGAKFTVRYNPKKVAPK